MLNPNDAFIALSKRAGDLLRAVGIASKDENADDIKKTLIKAIGEGGIRIVKETVETHFLAEANVNGINCFLLCVSKSGSPAGNKRFTTVIKGVMLPSDAKELLRLNKGLAPIGRTIAQNRWAE